MREWIMGDAAESHTYLVRFTNGGTLVGWQRADASGVIDVLRDAAWAEFTDSDMDDFSVSILTEMGVLPVVVKLTRDEENSLVGVDLTYRDPIKRGRAAYIVADQGAYVLLGA